MLGFFGGFFDTWNARHKVTFDGVNKLIVINYGENKIDVQKDIYTAWKEWATFTENINAKYEPAFKVVGGDPTLGSQIITPYFFLTNGWRVRPFEGNHILQLDGILLVEGGGDVFVPTLGVFNVGIQSIIPLKAETVVIDNTIYPDTEAPTWDGLVGIIDCYQNGSFLNVRWATATDVSGVNYKIYISKNQSTLFTLTNIHGVYAGAVASINTEADNISELTSGTYYVGVRAVDKYGNTTDNTNFMVIDYVAGSTEVGLTAQQVWEYANRSLTVATGGGLNESELHLALDSYTNKDAWKATTTTVNLQPILDAIAALNDLSVQEVAGEVLQARELLEAVVRTEAIKTRNTILVK